MIIIKNNKTYNVEYNEGVTYNKQVKYTEPPTPTLNYFYVEDISGSNNTLSITKSNEDTPTIEVFCSTDTVNWTSMGNTDTTAITATVPANDKLYLKANTILWGGGAWGYGGNEMTCSGNYNVGGNIMSLLNGDNFEGTRFPDAARQFQRLFQGSTTLVNAKDIVFPNNTNYACYRGMFSGCTSLVSVSAYADTYSGNGFEGWLNNVSATGDFYNLGGATFPSGGNGIPSGWTEHKVNCNVSISAGSNGSVSVNGATGNYSQSVAYNTQLTLVAIPDSGYIFGSWSDGDTNATRTITVTNDLTLTAAFDVSTGVPDYHIRYTTTNNQQQNFNTTGLTVLSHTFNNGVGEMVLDPSTLTLPQYFADNNTLATIEFGNGILFTNQYVLASRNETSNLTSVTFPSDLTYIGHRVVRNRKGITTLDIPATVTSIGAWIGWKSSLQTVICRATTPPTIETEAFILVEPYTISSTNIISTVYVPANSVTAYQTASKWSDYVAAGMQILSI